MESTGIYSQALACFLVAHDVMVSVVNPLKIKGFSQSCLVRNKTDKADAILIAKFCQAIQPSAWEPKPESITKLQSLVRRFDDLQKFYYQEQNRLEASDAIIIESIEKIQSMLQSEMEAIEKQIEAHIQSCQVLKDKQQLLISIPGVGDRTTSKLLAFCGNIEAFQHPKQLAAYAGLNPSHRTSGTSVNGKSRLSKMGNAEIRKALYMPALVAMKHNPIIKCFCEQLHQRGKPKMVVVCAAMRKLIHIIFGVLHSQKPFNATY